MAASQIPFRYIHVQGVIQKVSFVPEAQFHSIKQLLITQLTKSKSKKLLTGLPEIRGTKPDTTPTDDEGIISDFSWGNPIKRSSAKPTTRATYHLQLPIHLI